MPYQSYTNVNNRLQTAPLIRMEQLELHLWISRSRKIKGMTQRELAKRIGVTPQAVGLWEKPPHRGGTEPRRARLTQIEEILGAKYSDNGVDDGSSAEDLRYIKALGNRTDDLLERRLLLIEDILHADVVVLTMLEALIKRIN